MPDRSFTEYGDNVSSPARRCFVITPDDGQAQPILCKSLRAVGAGVIRLQAVDSAAPVDHPVYDGERIDVRTRMVYATGTSGVTQIIGYA